jgi:hypothetical protein
MRTLEPSRNNVPRFFAFFLTEYVSIDDIRLARMLWSRLYPTPELLYRITEIHATHARPEAIHAFARALPPTQLIAAVERLVRVEGRTKRLIRLEEAILEKMTADGKNWL